MCSLFIPLCLLSQVGYKDYAWGMTINQVKETATDLAEVGLFRFAAPSYAIMYLFSSELISDVPNPLLHEKGRITSYESEKQELKFYFLDNKLLSVEVTFFRENILPEIIRKYGNVNPIRGSFGGYRYETASWEPDPKRLLVWEKSTEYEMETVYYIDGIWFSNIRRMTMNAFRNEKQRTRSKLD